MQKSRAARHRERMWIARREVAVAIWRSKQRRTSMRGRTKQVTVESYGCVTVLDGMKAEGTQAEQSTTKYCQGGQDGEIKRSSLSVERHLVNRQIRS